MRGSSPVVLCMAAFAAVAVAVFPTSSEARRRCHGNDLQRAYCHNRRSIDPINPFPNILTTARGVVHGNIHEISRGVGGMVIKAGCPTCSVVAGKAFKTEDQAFAEAVVGRGWLLFVATEQPVFVLVDAVKNTPKEYALTHPAPNPLTPSPTPSERPRRAYKAAGALCAVQTRAGEVAVGWVDAPVFAAADGTTSTYPNVNLVAGDLIDVQAQNKECPVPNAEAGQVLIDRFRMTFKYSSTQPGDAAQMKYFLMGALAAGAPKPASNYSTK